MHKAGSIIVAAIGLSLLLAGCGGGDDGDDATPTAQPSATAASGVTPTTTGGAGTTGDPIATGPSASAGKTYTQAQAQAIVASVPLVPTDFPDTWTISTDTTTDAAQAAAASPETAASIERCQQLMSRLLVLMTPDQVTRYIGGLTVSYFTNLTVYATDEGAADCAAEAAVKYGEDPTALAQAFGSVFIDPAAVTITPISFPTVGQGSFASNLTGTIKAGDLDVDLTIMIVAFSMGNVSAVVGLASAYELPIDDLVTQVELVTDRIAAAQAAE